MKNILILIVISFSYVSCISKYKVFKNEDIKVKFEEKEQGFHLTVKNIQSTPIALGVKDSVIENDTACEIQIGEYSYLQTFMTDFKLLNIGQSYSIGLNEDVKNCKITLVYTKTNSQEIERGVFQESTTLLFPDGKFLIMEIKNFKKRSSNTKSIY